MKKIVIPTGIALILGLLIGYLLFHEDSSHEHTATDQVGTATLYTCSMHPQIMQPEPGDCPLCGMDLIPAETGAEGLAPNQFKMSEHAVALANIETSLVGASDEKKNSITLSGKIRPNDKTTRTQASYFKGRIEKLYTDATGEQVKQGALLATIYAPELIAAQQELLTTAAIKNTQPALYRAVRKKLKLWKLSDKQIDQIETEGKVIEYFPVYATISGTVIEKLVKEGDYVSAGQPLFRVANLEKVWAVLDAYEKQFALLKTGQQVQLTTNAYPGDTFTGIIQLIDPVMNAANRTTDIRVELDNKNGRLMPGMFIKGTITAPGADTGITVPKSAVMWTGKRSVVYVKPDPSHPVFELREIELGAEKGDHYEVKGGLETGEYVVTNGTFTVDAAAQLQDKPSMMNRETKSKETENIAMYLPETFQKALWPLLDEYIGMNEYFVASKPKQVQEQAKILLSTYEAVNLAALGQSEKTMMHKAGQMITAIANSSDIENQRAHLVILSDIMVAFAKNTEHLPVALYVQNCPMANQNKGADWLSKQENILNPYYGDMMLTCGSVTDTLSAEK